MLKALKNEWMNKLKSWITSIAEEWQISLQENDLENLFFSLPPEDSHYDLALGCFTLAKILKQSPQKIAQKIQEKSQKEGIQSEAINGYFNFCFFQEDFKQRLFSKFSDEIFNLNGNKFLSGRKIMMDFSSPNANKPLHLGHLRNNVLGESLARILKLAGADVFKTNIINDRGVHICKAMLAYEKFGLQKSPESQGIKSDHYVGDWYVRYSEYEKNHPQASEECAKMLRDWESGEPQVRRLWKKITDWAVKGIKETYKRTGIHFDKFYYESDLYELGKEIVLKGVEKGLFYKKEDGTIVVDLPFHNDPETKKPQQKTLLRKDGTSIYLTQDIGLAIKRYEDYPYDSLIYVVGDEQDYHFKVLFYVFSLLGYDWTKNLYHLSYGMVELPDGKMKSREGNVVDADTLLDEIVVILLDGMQERNLSLEEKRDIAEKMTQGAINYFLANATPTKTITFHKEKSLSLVGNTGPYLQYTAVRLVSLQNKAKEHKNFHQEGSFSYKLLSSREEWLLIKKVCDFPQVIESVVKDHNPAHLTRWTYQLCRLFNQFYQEYSVINMENLEESRARIALCNLVLKGLQTSMNLLNIPLLRRM